MAEKVRRLKELGPLQDLLLRCCQPDEKSRKSIPILAKQLNMTTYGVYKWIEQKHVPSKRVFELITLSGGECDWSEFLPYVFNKDADKVKRKK